MLKLKLLIPLLLFLNCPAAFALLEARVNLGGAFIDPNDFNLYLTTQGVKQTYIMGEMGADAILELPGTGLGVGLRYMYAGLKLDGISQPASSADMEWHLERYMAIGRYLVTSSNFSIGPIVAVGVAHKPQMRIKNTSGTISQYDTASSSSFNLGLDMGIKFYILKFGIEGGYQYYVINNFTGPSSTTISNLRLSGMYATAHLGLSF